ncbi:dihydrodipicolinate synthase family protein [Nesterenkonia sp.]|uniref:dihydrodipicolinate synthase family protein n=1 Tax=Nesterenkonia sp. TaxID=704201 RepID=UPI00261ED0E3|nr:dihydrodipicolinate synthase family protein [Nesterenkonia sp.]
MSTDPLSTRSETGLQLRLIDADRQLVTAPLLSAPDFRRPEQPLSSRTLFAAAHVVPDPLSETVPGEPAELDWDATLNYRRQLFSWGLGVADAMDTAQRNMGLDAEATRELIARSAAVAKEEGASVAVGVNTDARTEQDLTLDEIEAAYQGQLSFAESRGAIPVLMASRHLARAARDAEDYRRIYGSLLQQAQTPVIIHWLGEAFDPQLRGYFGSTDWRQAAETLISIIEAHPQKVSGVKMSLLDAEAEKAVRARLPETATMFTGDDFNYVGLIDTDDDGRYSDALLGAFSVLAPNASAAVQALDAGDHDLYRRILLPTQELSRQVFAVPTFYYKTGVAFLSWLNGHQASPAMVGGLHAARSLPHLSRIVELANDCGALEKPEFAHARWHQLLDLHGIGGA